MQYAANIGIHELYLYFKMATPCQKRIIQMLMNQNNHSGIMLMIERVTGVHLTISQDGLRTSDL